MLRTLFGLRASKSVVLAAAAALLLAAALPGSALGAGPDDPPPSSSVKTGAGPIPETGGTPADTANGNTVWVTFEGHAFLDGDIIAAGRPIIACLGGCDDGYSASVDVGDEGVYSGLKVGRSAAVRSVSEESNLITFWLVTGSDSQMRAHQPTIFPGKSETRSLDLSFETIPDDDASPVADAAALASATPVDNGYAAGDDNAAADWRTTDLTQDDAADHGLMSVNSAAGFTANAIRYQGVPVLPGIVTALGLTLAGVGVSLLMYRRRITW